MPNDNSQQHNAVLDSKLKDNPVAMWAMAAFGLVLLGGPVFIIARLSGDLSPVHEASSLPYILLGVALLTALGFEFVNGFHDTGERGCDGDLYALAGTACGRRLVRHVELPRGAGELRGRGVLHCVAAARAVDSESVHRLWVRDDLCAAGGSSVVEPADLVRAACRCRPHIR